MNYKKWIFVVLILFICTKAHAGYYVFHTNGVITGKRICGRVCRVRPDAIPVDKVTYDLISRAIHKVAGGIVVDKTQAELDAETAEKLQAQKDSETARIDAGEITIQELLDALISKGVLPLTKKEINDEVKLKNAILNP